MEDLLESAHNSVQQELVAPKELAIPEHEDESHSKEVESQTDPLMTSPQMSNACILAKPVSLMLDSE